MIAIGIIALIGASLLINFQRSHQERQEKDAADIVESKFRMAATLAKITGARVRVMFDEENGNHRVFISSNVLTSDRMKANISRKVNLHHVNDITLTPDNGLMAVSFYPWGLDDQDIELNLFFKSGAKTTCRPEKYAPSVLSSNAQEIDELFPDEIVEDEKEEKQIHTN